MTPMSLVALLPWAANNISLVNVMIFIKRDLPLGAHASCVRVASILLAVLLFAPSLSPQNREEKDPPSSALGTIIARYDRFEGKTKVEMRSMIVSERDDEVLLLNTLGEFAGTVAVKPTQINFVVARANFSPRQCGLACSLDVIADGERFKFPLVDTGTRRWTATLFLQMAGRQVEYSDFRRIVFAKKVEMRFEGTEFQLTTAQLASLRDFISRFGDK